MDTCTMDTRPWYRPAGLWPVEQMIGYFHLFIVATEAPRRRLVVTGDSARIEEKTTESSTCFFNILGLKHRYTGPRFNVAFERQSVVLSWTAGDSNAQLVVTWNTLFTSPTLYLLSWLARNGANDTNCKAFIGLGEKTHTVIIIRSVGVSPST